MGTIEVQHWLDFILNEATHTSFIQRSSKMIIILFIYLLLFLY